MAALRSASIRAVPRASRSSTVMVAAASHKVLLMGGTRFIGVYLARQLIAEGHDVTILTRGKKPVTFKIPTETDAEYEAFKSKVRLIYLTPVDPQRFCPGARHTRRCVR